MKKFLIVMVLMQILMLSGSAERIDRWARLRYLTGTWKMVTADAAITQRYSFLFNGMFMQMKTRAVFKPTRDKPRGETHQDVGIFSYDGHNNKLVLRSFHSEGFVNQYVLKKVSPDNKILTFVTESVENAPAGTRARLTFEKINNGEFKQRFYVAWPNKDYTCFSDYHFKKAN